MKFTLKDYQDEAVADVLDRLKKSRKRWHEDKDSHAFSLAGDFNDALAEHLVANRRAIDPALVALKQRKFPACCEDVVKLHGHFESLLVNFSVQWQRERKAKRKVISRASFASKYLHFHAPDAFPILDKYSELGLADMVAMATQRGASRYAKFCTAFSALMRRPDYQQRSLRHIDTELVEQGRVIDAQKAKGVKTDEGILRVAPD